MWILFLNDMRASNIENIQPRFRADSKEELKAFLAREAVEPYRDGEWGKVFRSGGPLEWFNPPWDHDEHRHFLDVGTADEWAERARVRYQQDVLSLPLLPGDGGSS